MRVFSATRFQDAKKPGYHEAGSPQSEPAIPSGLVRVYSCWM
jgi:hypothetical protein